MKIYLDNCCYNRPFDDQKQIKIYLETIAKLHIQKQIKIGIYNLFWSYILDFENKNNPYDDKKIIEHADWWNKNCKSDKIFGGGGVNANR